MLLDQRIGLVLCGYGVPGSFTLALEHLSYPDFMFIN